MSLIIMRYWKPTVCIQKVMGDGCGIKINAFFLHWDFGLIRVVPLHLQSCLLLNNHSSGKLIKIDLGFGHNWV